MERSKEEYTFAPSRTPLLNTEMYRALYARSIAEPEAFWAEHAKEHLEWMREWDTVTSGDLEGGAITWFEGGILNASVNCLDRHVRAGYGDQVAFFWEGNTGEQERISYSDMLAEVCRLANVFKAHGVHKGDRVCIYMPMIPEAVYAMLACARIGAVHTVVFGGFSAEALAARIKDADARFVVTADIGRRGEKVIRLLDQVGQALEHCAQVRSVLVVRFEQEFSTMEAPYIDYRTATAAADSWCDPEPMGAEDPLFILYTSGSTGKPKGVLHTTGGYVLYASVTHKYAFDLQEGDVYWCMADIGWITGHSYMVYGPLCNRTTSVLFEGVPTYPDAGRTWDVVHRYGVSVLYTTPTLVRTLMAYGDEYVDQKKCASLRVLGSVGEPINPEAWRWLHHRVGGDRCPIVDTWWQTETGGFAIASMAWVGVQKPGYCMRPSFGVQPVLLDESGTEVYGAGSGTLVLKGTWPGMMRDLWNDHERFLDVYVRPYPGYYLTGDGALRDDDGDIRVTGRIDDAMNVSGHLLGTAEIESALVLHPAVAEAAVVGVPDDRKGESMRAFVILKLSSKDIPHPTPLEDELITLVKEHVGSFAKPDKIVFVEGLPKTRSGKIMRRLLRKLSQGAREDLGDLSTLSEPSVIDSLVTSLEKES